MKNRLRSALRTAVLGSTCSLVGLLAPPSHGQQPTPRADDDKSPAVVLPRPKFQIPFSIDSRGVRPAKVQLWVSVDDGKNWQLHGTKETDAKFFDFRAAAEGEYLFLVQSIDQQGVAYPNSSKPLRVVVDTSRPQVELAADIDVDGNLVVDLAVQDDHLSPASAELRVRTDRDAEWLELNLPDFEQEGKQYFATTVSPIGQGREIAIIFRIEDAAGNVGEGTLTVERPRTAGVQPDLTLASTGGDVPSGLATEYRPSTKRRGIAALPGATSWEPAEPLEPFTPTAGGEQAATPDQRWASRPSQPGQLASLDNLLSSGDTGPSSEELPLPPEYTSQVAPRQSSQAPTAPQTVGNSEPEFEDRNVTRQPATSPSSESRSPADMPALFDNRSNSEVAQPGRRSAAKSEPFQCNSHAFSLDYSVESLGGSSLSEVQLWGTEDEGQTWQVWGVDPDRVSPFDVKVGNDGRFGFRMVIVGGNGLVSNRPKYGDDADVWIQVDTTSPVVGISRAVYGKGHNEGQLVIDFNCADSQLIDQPASLYFRGAAESSWTLVASNLAPIDTYLWKPPVNLPDQIHLKIEAVDYAGNIGSYELEQPIDIKGLAPRGHIHRVRPIR